MTGAKVEHGDMDTATSGKQTGNRKGARGRRAHPFTTARDLLTVRRAFGEPIRNGDITLVPVAWVMGGAGFGTGEGKWDGPVAPHDAHKPAGAGTGSGSGGGFGVHVAPIGVYVVRDADVQWQPALDLNRIILGGQIVGLVTVLVLGRTLRRRRRR